MARDINILVRNIPVDVDETINMLAVLNSMKKWEITRLALIEYASNHQRDIERLARGRLTKAKQNEKVS